MRNIVLILTIVVTVFERLSSAFILDDNCPVQLPCKCTESATYYTGYTVLCSHNNFTVIPNIKQVKLNVTKLNLVFGVNKLTVIPNGAFGIISSINTSEIVLDLSYNNIVSIENNAFDGIENLTTFLGLRDNNLSTIPLAISNLNYLQRLDIQDNPLHSLPSSVMLNLGSTLTAFKLDLDHFSEWPRELRYLRKLENLTVNHIPFSHLDLYAFHGVESTLQLLQLDYSKLEKVPYAICQLSHLTSLYMRYNGNLQENKSSIFIPCGNEMVTVTTLDLSRNGLYKFPDIFSLFPALTSLTLSFNNLQYIDYTKIKIDSKLTHLYLGENLFDRIPYALNKLKFLKTLRLSYNNIKTIDSPDLAGLHSLTELYLDINPVMFIAPDAFNHNVNLTRLNLYDTYLDHIPVAVTNLTKLSSIDFRRMPVDCTCDMTYLKQWNVSAIAEVLGICAFSSETIKHFVMNTLQSCP
ncbi:leucine-rich repeat protein soc-2 homolog [Ruditapes philippinarum]|uniref:leucine-rich repeat protein soc-2 homolog n=1 Tax=Ruditapes philippinarum TaxID=129788 RepID=UPI00295BDB8F|nr:leucine-rich repeat protein soc-2 homolog [Ruditapes philippinarum]